MDILVSELRNPMAHRTVLELGVPDKMDHSPVVAAGDKGGAVAWYRVRSGYKNDVLVQGFAYDGESFRVPYSATMVTELGDEHAAPPYWPAIAHIDANHYFVVWAEGANPDFFVVGRFVDLGE